MPTSTKSKRATPAGRATTARSTGGGMSSKGSTSQKRTGNGHSPKHMLADLEDAFIAELADMLHAEQELAKVLPKLAQAAGTPKLRDALEWHTEQTEQQANRLQRVFQSFARKPQTEVCEGMQGIVSECNDLLRKSGSGPVRDAMIIAATQKALHYEMAAYGTLCAWAEELEVDDAVRLLEDTLREKKGADRTLTRIAESFANPQAERDEGRYRGSEGRFGRDRERGEWRGYEEERHFGRPHEDWGRRESGEPGRMLYDEPGPRYGSRTRGGSGRERRYDE